MSPLLHSAADPHQQFFFVHLMKTAGTTFRVWASQNFAVDQIFPRRVDGGVFEQIVGYVAIGPFLELTAEQRRRLRFLSGHVPAAVAEAVAPDAVTVTVVRDPVERTLSYLRHSRRDHPEHQGLPLEEIYDDPWYFPRFIENYQTKMLAMTAEEARRGPADSMVARLNPEGRPLAELRADPEFVDAVRAELASGTGRALMTFVDRAPTEDIQVDEGRLAAAVAWLARADVVATTEHVDDLVTVMQQRFGWTGRPRTALNATVGEDVPPSFRQRIADDNAADVVLYETARRLRHLPVVA